MRKLNLLAGKCSFLYGSVAGLQLKCPILCSFYGAPISRTDYSAGFRQL